MGNKFMEYLGEFYEYHENEYGQQPSSIEKSILEDFCDYLQQHYEEEE